ncbi:M14 family metallopeptidase [Paenibacillus daejeonensis]|uniref:M14 family metallopeptidase n=1 Tax=Paenibacillus daejeonensis TaxID=135193 RepID=UPI000366A999|nr:M14 family metallopeptidase [Paenibacillus daejeonensis]
MSQTIEWGDIVAEPGQRVTGEITVAQLSHGGPVRMPVLIINGAQEGPCLWLNGAVHGDEINGPMAIRNLVHRLDPAQLTGSIIATPISNPLALQARQKNTPQDGLDLDMQFPGSAVGTISQRMADVLFQGIKQYATHLIDFHTLGSYFDALPYTVFKRIPAAEASVSDEAETLARVFDGSAHCRVDLGGAVSELPGNVAGFLDVQCLVHGIPAFMAEIGTGGVLEPEMVTFGERGIEAILSHLGMLELAVQPAAGLPARKPTVTGRRFLYTDHGGLAIDMAPSGSFLEPGDRLCRIVDMFGTVQDVRVEQPMYVIATRRNPPVDTGDRIAFVGTAWSEGGEG